MGVVLDVSSTETRPASAWGLEPETHVRPATRRSRAAVNCKRFGDIADLQRACARPVVGSVSTSARVYMQRVNKCTCQ